MSGPEAKNPAPAGTSAPDDLDVADLFEQLRERLLSGVLGALLVGGLCVCHYSVE